MHIYQHILTVDLLQLSTHVVCIDLVLMNYWNVNYVQYLGYIVEINGIVEDMMTALIFISPRVV